MSTVSLLHEFHFDVVRELDDAVALGIHSVFPGTVLVA